MRNVGWSRQRADEKLVDDMPRGGDLRLALAYANSYHLGMSSLALQRVFELVECRPRWRCERFFLDGQGMPLSVEADRRLSEFGCIAFSVSFEGDFVNLVRMLDRASVPSRRRSRSDQHPLIVMGGACAAINPLPMAEIVDVFALGAAENLLPALLDCLESETSRSAALERLASTPGFFVPEHHDPENAGLAEKLRKLELTAEQMKTPGHLPTTAIVTPHTEFSRKFLVEMSRGCPEKCRYCWATFGMGTFRWHPTDYILESFERARRVTDQVGFVATAVGDHPEVERILAQATDMGFRAAVSSIRIPAVTEGVLRALRSSGDKSITLAPETGSDALRAKMGKPVTNELLLEKIRLIFAAGFTQLKLYFIIGLPGETDTDVRAIVELAAEARSIMIEQARKTGVIGQINLGASVLVPKPYTPWQREPFSERREVSRRLTLLRKGVLRLPNVSLGSVSIRQALWQTYISRAGSEGADAIERMARGEPLSAVLRSLGDRLEPEVFTRLEGELRWHFMRTG
jgi:radical SAM superfamily enzyme YgiQ (UPF0313 family)